MAELILIVDDDPVQRRLLDAMARRFGYEVIVADGGDAAIAALTGPDGAFGPGWRPHAAAANRSPTSFCESAIDLTGR